MGSKFSAPRPDRTCGPRSFLYKGYRVSFSGVKRPGRGVHHPPHLVPRLKKEYSYASTHPLLLHDLLQGELYFFLSYCLREQGISWKNNIKMHLEKVGFILYSLFCKNFNSMVNLIAVRLQKLQLLLSYGQNFNNCKQCCEHILQLERDVFVPDRLCSELSVKGFCWR